MDPTLNDDDNDNDNSSLNDDDSLLQPDFYTSAIASESSSDSDPDPPPPTSVTIAIPAAAAATPVTTLPLPRSKQPIEDSRRLFQRLWTDEDEIELLQGFLDYTSSRGGLHHHHDSSAFYDIIKSKLQLDFNKNQLVEKLRRLKKKYRTVLAKINSGKEFAFKSPHDQITFELSSKIWCDLKPSGRGGSGGNGGGDFDDDDPNPNPNASGSGAIVAVTPPLGGYYVGHVNLNSSASGGGSVTPVVEQKPNFGTIVPQVGSPSKLSTRKRERVKVERMDDRFVRVNLGQTGVVVGGNGGVEGVNVNVNSSNISNNSTNSNVNVGPGIQGMIEETMRNCLLPVLKELINTAMNVNANVNSSGVSGGGAKGIGALSYNAMPLNFSGVNFENGGELMNEKWRNQQILELEVYSKRLELIQDQIKLTLDELRSMGG